MIILFLLEYYFFLTTLSWFYLMLSLRHLIYLRIEVNWGLGWLPARQCVGDCGAPRHCGIIISSAILSICRGPMVHHAVSTSGVIEANASRAEILNQWTVNGANGEDMANAREPAVEASRESIANAIIRRRKIAAITVSVSASSIAVAALENARQAVQISGMCYYVSFVSRCSLIEWNLNLAVRNKFTVAEIYQLTSIWKNKYCRWKSERAGGTTRYIIVRGETHFFFFLISFFLQRTAVLEIWQQ